ncbi:GCN5-related N-acetyltransferase [Fulvimarina pelagi HTCC2506]|uniref:GCN5-related N-acetyltransferase n=2 Tax=Fulvimarina pelagi TaxID=217511 RepID=Q0G1B1_9HYPH|nr:GNAT family N-acetyltransferase [Fulvimarina pelagi]EAU41170.1 GCN5-related N-acetyltransferase [Fulvimarina pelagi HTCC2506]BAT30817.1 GCN5-related N-acetyltransferase [Fulvimarina pelagi]
MAIELLTTRVTSLEMTADVRRIRRRASGSSPAMRIVEVPRLPLQRYRDLYASVGAAHHWTSRLLPDKALAEEIYNPRTRIYLAQTGHETVGWFEIEVKRNVRQARIVHFGILPPFRGRGLAGPLLEEAIAAGFAEGPERLTIETNTLDHPAALRLYRRHGFVPYATREVKTPTWASLAEAQTAAE